MKFTVSSQILLKKLSALAGVISPSNALPILDCFLFQVNAKELKVSSSDLETTMTSKIDIQSEDTGEIAIPSALLLEILKTFPELPLTFSVGEKKSIELSCDYGKYKLTGHDGADFPRPTQIESPSAFEMEEVLLLKGINKTLFAVGADELRPAMCGVFINIDQNGITFVSTDSHKLSKYRQGATKTDKITSYIIPKKPLGLLKNLLSAGKVNVQYNNTNVCFSFADVRIISRLIDQKYPNYDSVIPKDNPNILKVSRINFLNSIKRVSVFSSKMTSQICLSLKTHSLVIKAEDLDYSNEATENVACEYTGADLIIGFNAKFLMEVLSGLESDEIIFELNTPTRAGIIKPVGAQDGEDSMMLVMPVMLTK